MKKDVQEKKKELSVSTTQKVAQSTEKKSNTPKGKYYYAVGRRKSSTAQVRTYSTDKELSNVDITINEKSLEEYVVREDLRNMLTEPLRLAGLEKNMHITLLVRGGGMRGQVEAARLALSRSLVEYDENLRSIMKSAKMLTRDARRVERKKPGLRKARRSPQWSKR